MAAVISIQEEPRVLDLRYRRCRRAHAPVRLSFEREGRIFPRRGRIKNNHDCSPLFIRRYRVGYPRIGERDNKDVSLLARLLLLRNRSCRDS